MSGYARLGRKISESEIDGLFLGCIGGEGIGQYIQGVSDAAVFENGSLSTLEGIGAYLGYQRTWQFDSGYQLGTNLAYGAALMESSTVLDADKNRELQQAWWNLVLSPNPNVAMGLEYHFGRRETMAAGNGENHRFMFVVSLTSLGKSKVTNSFRNDQGTMFTREEVMGSSPSANAYRQSL